MRRGSLARALPWPAVVVLAAVACLALAGAAGSAPGPASMGPPQRDHAHGHWFAHSCAQAPAGQAACGAQVVTNSSGVPLATGTPVSGSYGPPQLLTAYGLPNPQTAFASAPTVAIVDAYDDPNIASDVANFDSEYNLPALNTYSSSSTPSPWLRKVNQSGGTSPPAGNSGWALEISLDVETVHEICQYCNILLVEASSNSFANLGAAENEAFTLGASIATNSWGGGDSSSDTALDTLYFTHPGHVITASTGDSGYGVEYPASSQDVIGVGGTTLNLGANNSYGSEAAWADGGSGCSAYEPKPTYQQATSGCSGKTVADVSADADPNTGAAVYDTYGYGGWLQVGGTSLASPLIASVYALAGNTSSPGTPYGDHADLHDVTSGANTTSGCSPTYLCTAGSGYDGPTGWGTPKGLGAFAGTPPAPGYSLSATPSSQTVTQGQTASYTVTLNPNSTFPTGDTVTVTVGGAPGTPAGCSLTTSSSKCTVNIATSTSTTPQTYSLAFTGNDPDASVTPQTETANANLTVNAAPAGNFSLSISPSNQTLQTPGSVKYTVTVTDMNGFTGAATLSVSGLPAGLTGTFSPNPASTTATLTISAPSRLGRHNYSFTVTGTSGTGTLSHSISGRLSTR
jgi:subtilase family serine protease